jgi:Bacterial Ig domain
VTIRAKVTAQVSWVNFYIDGTFLGASPPYRLIWHSATVANGTHHISATAFDSSAQQIGSDTLSVHVRN